MIKWIQRFIKNCQINLMDDVLNAEVIEPNQWGCSVEVSHAYYNSDGKLIIEIDLGGI